MCGVAAPTKWLLQGRGPILAFELEIPFLGVQHDHMGDERSPVFACSLHVLLFFRVASVSRSQTQQGELQLVGLRRSPLTLEISECLQ